MLLLAIWGVQRNPKVPLKARTWFQSRSHSFSGRNQHLSVGFSTAFRRIGAGDLEREACPI